MRRFDEIEGLRAWLSWTVVFWHVLQSTGLYTLHGFLRPAEGAAATTVEIFMIVSGFVVTHLLVTRAEPFGQYITRRAFRLFPVYLVALAIGVGATYLAGEAIRQGLPWANDPNFSFDDHTMAVIAAQTAHPVVTMTSHLLLLQGAIPDSVIPHASTAYLGPAWSLSLEWQFYLVAPVVVLGLRTPRWSFVVALVLAAAYLAFELGLLGEYRLRSVFPGAVLLFLTGIGCRLGLQWLSPLFSRPTAFAVLAICVGMFNTQFRAIGLWFAFFAFMAGDPVDWRGLDAWIGRLFRPLFGSAPARWVGARSYAVYAIHWPMMEIALYLLRDHFTRDQFQAFLLVGGLTVPMTIVGAEILHRVVELPMMRAGTKLASGMARRQSSAVHSVMPDPRGS